MTELAVRQTSSAVQTVPPASTETTMRLVDWAREAEAAYSLAENLCKTPFAGSWKGDALGATAAILKGAEVGLTPVTALGAFDNIQGTPAPKALTLRALVQAHGHDLEITEETDERAVASYRRNGRGEWRTTEFTIADARQMKLTGKDNWQKQPRNMLVARVTSKAARLVAADVILGIGYSSEELYDSEPPRPVASVQQPTTGADRVRGLLGKATPEPEPDDATASAGNVEPEPVTAAQLKKIGAAMGDLGITDRTLALAFVADVIGREVESRNDLTKAEASDVIEALERDLAPTKDAPEPELDDPTTDPSWGQR